MASQSRLLQYGGEGYHDFLKTKPRRPTSWLSCRWFTRSENHRGMLVITFWWAFSPFLPEPFSSLA
jgi:hypothetical protein